MSVMRRGDEELHYSDNSHRWIAPPDVDQGLWEAGVRAHMSLHLATMGGPIEVHTPRKLRPACVVPNPRTPAPVERVTTTRRARAAVRTR